MKIEPLKISLSLPQEDIEEVFDIGEFLIDPYEEVPEPIPILAFMDKYGKLTPIITEDNLSLVKGKAKSRKSTLIKAIGTAIMKRDRYPYGGVIASNYERNHLAIVDTEQGKYHCWRAARTISLLAGNKVDYFKVAGLNIKKKKRLVEIYLEQTPQCGIIILDNIVHFLKDYNNADESSELNEWLIATKNKYNCHIMMVLHENGSQMGGGKAKGHLGSLLENTCETVIRVEKDGNDKNVSIVSGVETRNKEFDNFTIEMDNDWTPHLRHIDDAVSTDKKDLEKFRSKQF